MAESEENIEGRICYNTIDGGELMKKLTWEQITSEDRIPKKEKREAGRYRSEIESDYHRIIRSASYRRLQDKTQVFPLDTSDFVRTRLTHSMEVSSLARLMGKQVCEEIIKRELEAPKDLPDTLKVMETLNCAGLLHDLGNPPFGHFGEESIRNWFRRYLDQLTFQGKSLGECLDRQQRSDLENFEGNAQALRIITKLHRLIGNNGMHLTSAVMDTIIKYPQDSLGLLKEKTLEKSKRSLLHKKIGYFQSEEKQYQEIKRNTGTMDIRNPLCYLLEAADDLAYTFADLEDGYNKGLYTVEELLQIVQKAGDDVGAALLQKELEKAKQEDSGFGGFDARKTAVFSWLTRKQLYCVSCVTETFLSHYSAIMDGTYAKELLLDGKEGSLIKELKSFAYQRIYLHSSILKLELMGNEVLEFLLSKFVDALIYYDTSHELTEIQKKYIDLLSVNYVENYHQETKQIKDENTKLYYRLLLASDFIAGMTDSYAKRLYQELHGF